MGAADKGDFAIMRCPVSYYIELKGRQARVNMLGSSSTTRYYRRSLLAFTRASLAFLNTISDGKKGQHNTKFDFTVDEEKERLNPSREKNYGTHRRKKVDEKSCATFLLCDPGWYIQRT